MINGAHVIIYTTNAAADRGFLRDVLSLPHVDVGAGWLIFGLPPSEVAVHPSSGNDSHELYFMCEDIQAFVAAMTERGIECGPVGNQGWGLVTRITLPGGGKIGVYEPRHARPEAKIPTKRPATKKKAAKRKAAKTKVAPKKAAKKKARRR